MSELNTKNPRLSDDTATKLLQNVFTACQQEPNTVPLPKLVSYSEYRKERYLLQKILLIAVLVIFMLLPMFFITPKFEVEKVSPDSDPYPTYNITLLNKLPVSSVAASIEGEGLVVSEVSENVYCVMPTKNGTLKVMVRLLNRQYKVLELEVTGIDVEPPELISDSLDGGYLRLFVEDAGLGIDYEGVYAVDEAGNVIYPVSAADGELVFELPDGATNIYIPDVKGNTLHLAVSLHYTENEASSAHLHIG